MSDIGSPENREAGAEQVVQKLNSNNLEGTGNMNGIIVDDTKSAVDHVLDDDDHLYYNGFAWGEGEI